MISWYFFDDPFKQFYHLTTAFRLDHNDDKYHKTRNTGYLIVITQIPKETSTINNNCNGKYNENIEKKERIKQNVPRLYLYSYVLVGWGIINVVIAATIVTVLEQSTCWIAI